MWRAVVAALAAALVAVGGTPVAAAHGPIAGLADAGKRAAGAEGAPAGAGASATRTARAAYEPGTVIVRYRASASGRQRLDAAAAAGVVRTLATIRPLSARLVRVSGDPAAVARRLRASPAVDYAEPNWIARTTAVPSDPRFGEQYALHNVGQTGGTPDADIDAPEGWDALGAGAFPDSGGAKIGIVDTGVAAAHEDLAGRVSDCAGVRSFGIGLLGVSLFSDPTIVAGRCADDNGHGTHVAGIAGARANNARGIAGVAFNAPLAVCKGLDASGGGGVAGIANCIGYLADAGARVISMSLGTSADSTTLRSAVTAASSRAVVVAASGNSGNTTPNYPAAYPEVVSVAATDSRDARAGFSTFNDDVEVAAPGVAILSTWLDGGYRPLSGTSMATPHAAGVASAIAARFPAAGPAAWRARLLAATDDVATPGRDPQTGFGRVNLLKAATG